MWGGNARPYDTRAMNSPFIRPADVAENAPVDWAVVEWVILDMDGTILDLAYDNYFWGELVPQRYAEKNQLTLERAREILRPEFESIRHTLPWYCTDYWTRVTGINMAELKRECRARIGPIPGAVEFLHAVRASGRQLWLATNAHRDSWQLKLEHCGLRSLFDQVICSHDFGAPKEDQHFWRAAQAAHPFDPARSLFVDDSQPVLDAAVLFGIRQVRGIRKPDSGQPLRDIHGVPGVHALAELMP